MFLHADGEDSDQTGCMHSRFESSLTFFVEEKIFLPTTNPSLFDRVR